MFSVVHRGMPVVRLENFDEIIVVVNPYGRGDFRQRHIRRDDKMPRLVYALFVDVAFGGLVGVFFKHIVQLLLRKKKFLAQRFNG